MNQKLDDLVLNMLISLSRIMTIQQVGCVEANVTFTWFTARPGIYYCLHCCLRFGIYITPIEAQLQAKLLPQQGVFVACQHIWC